MRERKFSLYRKDDTEAYVSNWTILGYVLPSIGIFVILMAFITIDPYMAYWGTLIFAWWLVPIIIISAIVLFFKALKKEGILKQCVLRCSLINLLLFLFLVFVRMPLYNCDALEMAKHYDRKTEQFDELITYAYSPSVTQNPNELKRLLRKSKADIFVKYILVLFVSCEDNKNWQQKHLTKDKKFQQHSPGLYIYFNKTAIYYLVYIIFAEYDKIIYLNKNL